MALRRASSGPAGVIAWITRWSCRASILLLAGCSSTEPAASQRSIDDLYREAILTSRIRSDPAERVAMETGAAETGPLPSSVRVATVPRSGGYGEVPIYVGGEAHVRQAPRPRPADPEPAPQPVVYATVANNLFETSPAQVAGVPAEDTPRVTDTFIATDLRQAIQSLAAQAGVSCVLDELVRGTADCVIEDEPFESALTKLLMPMGYVWVRQEGAYIVASPDPASKLFPRIAERRDYEPLHLSVEELMEMAPGDLRPFLRPSSTRNLIVVEAPPELAERALRELAQSDQPVPQVVFEALICVLTPETRKQLGVDLAGGARIGDKMLQLGLENLDLSALYAPAGMGGTQSFEFTSAFVRALAQEGYLAIRAAPRVMARDGEKARITIGRETFFAATDSYADNRSMVFSSDVERVESGIVLEITPRVRGNRVHVLIDRAEVSEELRNSSDQSMGRDNRYPIINRRWVSTTITVRDQNTIVIGGLTQRQRVERKSKVPVLGDLPGVGAAFRQSDEREEETEVAIFISPRIVREDAWQTRAASQ